MNPNPPIKGHALLNEGNALQKYLLVQGTGRFDWVTVYGCECGRRPYEILSINATKRWHREHKNELRAVAS